MVICENGSLVQRLFAGRNKNLVNRLTCFSALLLTTNTICNSSELNPCLHIEKALLDTRLL